MDRRDESLPLKPNIPKKKSKERQGRRTNAVEARTAGGLFSVCFDAAQVRWSLNEKLRISLEAPLFVFKASPPKMLTNHQSNRLML